MLGSGPQPGQRIGGTERNFPGAGSSEVACPRNGRSDGIPQTGSSPADATPTLPEPCSNTVDPNLPAGWSSERPNLDGPAGPAGHADGPGREEVKPQGGERGGRGGPRRGGKGKDQTTSLVIFNKNVCGLNSKKLSISSILDKLIPDVCTFQETNVTGNNKIKINKNYHMSFRNRKYTKKMRGVATAVANNLKQHWSKVSEGENDDEQDQGDLCRSPEV